MLNGRLRATVLALAFALAFGDALPALAQEQPLGEEMSREEREEHERAMEHHRREMERHREEMERHARAMRDALLRAYRDTADGVSYYRFADSTYGPLRDRFIYSARVSTPCARMGFAFDGTDTITVREVLPGSAAQEAGVRTGDVVLRVNGERADQGSMTALAEEMEPGDRIRLDVRRDGREQSIEVTAREAICPFRTMLSQEPFGMTCLRSDSAGVQPDEECEHEFVYTLRKSLEGFEAMREHMPRIYFESGDSSMVLRFGDGFDSLIIDLDSVRMMSEALTLQVDSLHRLMPYTVHIDSLSVMFPLLDEQMRAAGEAMNAHGVMVRSMALGSSALAGAQLTAMNEDLSEYFEVEGGVLVTRVEDDTPAARAGLRGGDVVVSINGNEVDDLEDVRRHAWSSSGPLELVVVRRGDRVTIRLAQ